MAFGDGPGASADSVPAWARRAQEPLVPVVHLASVKKSVMCDVKEIQKASDEIAKLRKQKASRDVGERLLTISKETRQRARQTSSTIRTAFASAAEGSSDHAALTALSDDFKGALRRFQLEAEAAAPSSQSQPMGGGAFGSGVEHAHVVDMQAVPAERPPDGGQMSATQVAELQAVALNEDVIAEREQGIANIHRTVRVHQRSRGSLHRTRALLGEICMWLAHREFACAHHLPRRNRLPLAGE